MKEKIRRSPDKELEAGTKYTITGVEGFFDSDTGGRGLLVNTTAGLCRTASKIVMAQLTAKKTIFPVAVTLVREKSKTTGKAYEFLREDVE
jgi:hypothetical protein